MTLLESSLHSFLRQSCEQAQVADLPACILMEALQCQVSQLWPAAHLSCFGSRATGLACATSDVDLVVVGVPGLDVLREDALVFDMQLAALSELSARLELLPAIKSINLQKSTVPVLAVTAAIPSMANTSSPVLHLDISLNTHKHSGLKAAAYVRSLHQRLPMLRPLVVILKEMLHRHQLKSAFTGGLSSYALVLLLSQFLLHHDAKGSADLEAAVDSKRTSTGELLLRCLHFFGEIYEADSHGVCVGQNAGHFSGGAGFVLRNHRSLSKFSLDPLLVLDPVNLSNNAGKSCYRIRQIQALFCKVRASISAAAETAIGQIDAGASIPSIDFLHSIFGPQ